MILHNFVTLRGGGFLANSAGGCGKSVRNAEVFPVTRCLGLGGAVFAVMWYFGIVYYSLGHPGEKRLVHQAPVVVGPLLVLV